MSAIDAPRYTQNKLHKKLLMDVTKKYWKWLTLNNPIA